MWLPRALSLRIAEANKVKVKKTCYVLFTLFQEMLRIVLEFLIQVTISYWLSSETATEAHLNTCNWE